MNLSITENEVEELTRKLISFPSMTGTKEVLECAQYIQTWFLKLNIEAEIITYNGVPNVVARVGKKGGRRLLLDGHFDVVPPGDAKEWHTDPFCATSKDGYIYGRGAGDMKSGLAAAMTAMKKLKEQEDSMEGEVVFYGIGDEETGSVNGSVALLAEHDKEFDGAIVPEPSDFCIERAQRGLRWIQFHIKGKACHAGRPHIGKNAIEQAAKMIYEIKNIEYNVYEDIFEEGLKKPSLSINRIDGGIKNNVVAEDCSFLVDRRMLPGETVTEVMEQLENAAKKALDDGFSYDISLYNNGWDPFITDKKEPIVSEIVKSFYKIVKETPVVRGKGGCTDASHIHNAGIPVVILGPGNADESHTSNEKCEIKRIALTAEIIWDTAIQFLNNK